MHANNRKLGYKLPPTIIRDKLVSQEARRNKALEEQKRRRAQRIDSSRQLDLFADLNLGLSDDDEEPVLENDDAQLAATPASVAPYVSMLQEGSIPNAITNGEQVFPSEPASSSTPSKKKPKKRGGKKRSNKPSKWADKCMYAELLEMSADIPWNTEDGAINDGLPTDLETGWVAVAPVPAGKRCLAVTHQSSGIAGVVPNTTLKSRLLGKTLIHRFPSNLPPLSILDCILDVNWRDNGILHVLDVVKWKGQDVGDCEAPFRFWWRDTRLKELSQSLPPTSNLTSHFVPTQNPSQSTKYRFPYPTTFLPIPYHTDTSLPTLEGHVIPTAREWRTILVQVPTLIDQAETGMEVESSSNMSTLFTFQSPQPDPSSLPSQASLGSICLSSVPVNIQPDGLLLYVSQASFEPGTSPLSSWVPITSYDDHAKRQTSDGTSTSQPVATIESPLDIFQGLVKNRLQFPSRNSMVPEVEMN